MGSGLESVRPLPALKVIEEGTFNHCRNLKSVEFSEGLEKIGVGTFFGSGIEDIVLPSSVRVIYGFAFAKCKHLRSIRLNEVLEVLGAEVVADESTYKGTVFF